MGENICKSRIWKGIYIQNIERTKIQQQQQNYPIHKQAGNFSRHFLKDIQKWSISTRKDARCYLALGKYKSKPQWGTTSHSLGRLLKKQKVKKVTSIDEDVEKL